MITFIIAVLLVLFIIIVALPVKMVNYLIDLKNKHTIVVLFVFCLVSIGHSVKSQSFKEFVNQYEVGLESSFGIKSFRIRSNIPEIKNLAVLEEGGTMGIVWGAKSFVARLSQGYYYSAASVPYTVDEIRSAAVINFYPFYFLYEEARLRPYLMAGIERDIFKMYGFYDHKEGKKNYAVLEAPYLGKISTIQAGFGGGIEYRVKTPGHFVAIFGEMRYGKSIKTTSSNEMFNRTSTSAQITTNVGVAFGYYR